MNSNCLICITRGHATTPTKMIAEGTTCVANWFPLWWGCNQFELETPAHCERNHLARVLTTVDAHGRTILGQLEFKVDQCYTSVLRDINCRESDYRGYSGYFI